MATTHSTRIKKLGTIDTELAALRDQRAWIDARIANLESTRKEELIALTTNMLTGMNLARVSASAICAALHDVLDRSGDGRRAEAEGGLDGETVETFVRITRNVAIRKRTVLEQCGLHWHGRDGGWSGVVSAARLPRLREVFGDRVERPPLIEERQPHSSVQESAHGSGLPRRRAQQQADELS
ncbi:hypothetical protein [Bradyrhizobium sp. HKCCYLR20261]|uniref:hypothetical protein n=1 Tax=Bradyrhizobium sp. HKCCYLR20261 TaxID=3420760 RepID=UPI003EBE0D60